MFAEKAAERNFGQAGALCVCHLLLNLSDISSPQAGQGWEENFGVRHLAFIPGYLYLPWCVSLTILLPENMSFCTVLPAGSSGQATPLSGVVTSLLPLRLTSPSIRNIHPSLEMETDLLIHALHHLYTAVPAFLLPHSHLFQFPLKKKKKNSFYLHTHPFTTTSPPHIWTWRDILNILLLSVGGGGRRVDEKAPHSLSLGKGTALTSLWKEEERQRHTTDIHGPKACLG